MPAIRTCYTARAVFETHLDDLRLAVVEWCLARSTEGQFVVRISDPSATAFESNDTAVTLAPLHWLALDWDEGPDVGGPYAPYVESERLGLYQELAQVLIRSGHAYYCDCTPERLEAVYETQQANGQPSRYDNYCRTRNVEPGPMTAIRFRLPESGLTSIDDMLRGPLEFDLTNSGDPILVRADGYPSHHLATVVDDHHMEITHAMRTDEWLHSTPIDVLLYEALGWQPPKFVHLASMANLGDRQSAGQSEGGALPDIEFSTTLNIDTLHELGYLPEAVFNYLALLDWASELTEQILSQQEIVSIFSLDLFRTDDVAFSLDRLNWFNQQHISRLSSEQLLEFLVPRLLDLHQHHDRLRDPVWAAELIYCVRDELVTLKDIGDLTEFAFTDPVGYTQDGLDALRSEPALAALSALDAALPPHGTIPPDAADDLLKDLRREFKQTQDWNGGQVMLPLEAALTGAADELPLARVIALLDMKTCHRRIQRALDWVNS